MIGFDKARVKALLVDRSREQRHEALKAYAVKFKRDLKKDLMGKMTTKLDSKHLVEQMLVSTREELDALTLGHALGLKEYTGTLFLKISIFTNFF